MGLILFFRDQQFVNNFRNTLLGIIRDTSLDGIMLTYPYYSENKRDAYGALSNYSILDSGIKDSILSRDSYKIVTVAPFKLKNQVESVWTESYRNFVNKLRYFISERNIEYNAYFLDGYENFSHAKFCMGYKWIKGQYIPVVLLLGSSNLTNKTLEYYEDFNYESDVVIWDDENYSFSLNNINNGNLRPIYADPRENINVKRYLEYFDYKFFNAMLGKYWEV